MNIGLRGERGRERGGCKERGRGTRREIKREGISGRKEGARRVEQEERKE